MSSEHENSNKQALQQMFYQACIDGDMAQVQKLAPFVDIHAGENGGLRFAAENGRLDVVKFLHDKGVDLAVNENYAYIHAASRGHLHIMRYIEENKNPSDKVKSSAYELAGQNGHLDVMEHIDKQIDFEQLDTEISVTMFLLACIQGHLDIVKYLHQKRGINPYCEDGLALVKAATAGKADIVKYLIEECDVDFSARYDEALSVAVQCDSADCVEILHQKGADLRMQNDICVKYAAMYGASLPMFKYLHKHGLNMNIDDEYALRYMVTNRKLDVLQFLHQDCHANIRVYNDICFRQAAGGNSLDLVQYIYNQGADIAALDYEAVYNAVGAQEVPIVHFVFSKVSVNQSLDLKDSFSLFLELWKQEKLFELFSFSFVMKFPYHAARLWRDIPSQQKTPELLAYYDRLMSVSILRAAQKFSPK